MSKKYIRITPPPPSNWVGHTNPRRAHGLLRLVARDLPALAQLLRRVTLELLGDEVQEVRLVDLVARSGQGCSNFFSEGSQSLFHEKPKR